MNLGRDKCASNESLRNVLLLTDKELNWILRDIVQVSSEYFISNEYQNFADEFIKQCERIEL